jgi:hypothetical protein
MNSVAGAFAFAFANLLHPRMLWLMVWPVLVALALWGTVVLVFWTQLVVWLSGIVKQWMQAATFFVAWDAGDAAAFAAKALILVLFVPLVQLTALLILGVFGMPAMVAHVAGRRFPQLARRQGGSFAGSLWNGAVALFGLAALALLSIPFWVFPPLWPLIPAAILGWVNQRVLRYDALAEHAEAEEMREIFAASRGALYLLGLGLALVAYVPVVGWFAPVLVGLTFIHYLLAQLKLLRERPIEGRVV